MFLPVNLQEARRLGWNELDIVLVTGDAYVDSPYVGVALIGKVLAQAGYRVGLIAQPDCASDEDIARLGAPRLFWGVTGGCIDSMVANHTALKKRKQSDDMTAGGLNTRRPDRAVIAYANLIRRRFKHTAPIVLGGLEASLRRLAHYDYWDDAVRRSVLIDAKADVLVYGMGEETVLELAAALRDGRDWSRLPGLCRWTSGRPEGADTIELPPFEDCARDPAAFARMFRVFYDNTDALTAKTLVQRHDLRYVVQNPPRRALSSEELSRFHDLDFERAAHPEETARGKIAALDTIRFSINTHRGCYGECNFCAITVHQGRTVQWRTPRSVLAEARAIAKLPGFTGYILDAGGPTANMYGFECEKKLSSGACPGRRCLFPRVCPGLRPDHRPQIELLRALRSVPGVKKVFVASGIRCDLVLADRDRGHDYLREVCREHTGGQLKVAPEHTQPHVLDLMGKPGPEVTVKFRELFEKYSRGKNQFLSYYFIAAHPGCTFPDMLDARRYVSSRLRITPEQVQIFTPLPSTYSALMYHTGRNAFTGEKIFVEKTLPGKDRQKSVLTEHAAAHPLFRPSPHAGGPSRRTEFSRDGRPPRGGGHHKPALSQGKKASSRSEAKTFHPGGKKSGGAKKFLDRNRSGKFKPKGGKS